MVQLGHYCANIIEMAYFQRSEVGHGVSMHSIMGFFSSVLGL